MWHPIVNIIKDGVVSDKQRNTSKWEKIVSLFKSVGGRNH